MLTSYDVVKTLVRTEKGTSQEPDRKYLFEVAPKSNKIQIRKAIEEIYKVKVQSVRTVIVPGKSRRVRMDYGYRTDWKKAIVTLKEGQKIEVS